MDIEGREESENVEDRRGAMPSGRTLAAGGGGILVVIVAMILGINPEILQKFIGQNAPQVQPEQPGQKREFSAEEQKQAHFTKVIFKDTELVWDQLFQDLGKTYQKPVPVLFNDRVDSACGMADSAVGPFYCGGDSRVYIDLSFYQDMQRKLNAPGDFARAYVIAHEVGHHVQKLLGYSARAHASSDKRMSVRLELQADYLAGVWPHHAQRRFQYLQKGDVESALNAAFEIGDDRLQKKARGYVVPDSFTHGTSKQRQRWFMEGFRSGDVPAASRLFDMRYEDL